MAKFKKHNSKSTTFNYDPKVESVLPKYNHPIFCLRHIHRDFNIDKCDDKEKINFIDRLGLLSTIDWQLIQTSPKNGFGSEKISIKSLNVKCPKFITDDVQHLLALRFNGKMPFLIWRNNFLAHVIFIDPKGKVYDH